VSGVTDMQYMFFKSPKFNVDLSAWNVDKVTTMRQMFWSAGAFNGPLNWCVLNTVNRHSMFSYSACGSEAQCGLTVVSDLGGC